MTRKLQLVLICTGAIVVTIVGSHPTARGGLDGGKEVVRSIGQLRSLRLLLRADDARATLEDVARRYSLAWVSCETLEGGGAPQTRFIHEFDFGSRLPGSQKLLRLRFETYLEPDDVDGTSFEIRGSTLVIPAAEETPPIVLSPDGLAGFDLLRAALLGDGETPKVDAFALLAAALSPGRVHALRIRRSTNAAPVDGRRAYDLDFFLSDIGAAGPSLRLSALYDSRARQVSDVAVRQ